MNLVSYCQFSIHGTLVHFNSFFLSINLSLIQLLIQSPSLIHRFTFIHSINHAFIQSVSFTRPVYSPSHFIHLNVFSHSVNSMSLIVQFDHSVSLPFTQTHSLLLTLVYPLLYFPFTWAHSLPFAPPPLTLFFIHIPLSVSFLSLLQTHAL